MNHKHGGISRLAHIGDIGVVFGWGYAGPETAVINMRLSDNTTVCVPGMPLWVSEAFAKYRDCEVDAGDIIAFVGGLHQKDIKQWECHV